MTSNMNRSDTFRQVPPVVMLALILAVVGVRPAHGAEFIGSLGATKSVDNSSDNARMFLNAAVRAPIAPILNAEVGVAYRQDSFLGGDLKVRQWPITASLWLAPAPVVYAGVGVGWYMSTYDVSSTLLASTRTNQQFGMHLGGGLDLPLAPNLGVDLNGRYIFMQKNGQELPPSDFNPDFWTTSLGLAFKF